MIHGEDISLEGFCDGVIGVGTAVIPNATITPKAVLEQILSGVYA
jgi:hypothetical protein